MTLSREEKLARIEALREKKRRLLKSRPTYIPNEGQLQVHKDDSPIRFVAAGNGCWAKGTKFRLASGETINVEDIEPGDKLLGPDGTERTVLETHTGTEEMFEIQPKHSEKYTVNKSHILSLYRWRRPGEGRPKEKIYEEITVADYLNRSDTHKRVSYQWKAPGIELMEQQTFIDPYILGLWLGDGSSSSTAITTMDEEIRLAWTSAYPEYSVRAETQEGNKSKTYYLSNNRQNQLLEDLRGYELIKNKHIPKAYKNNSKKVRLELLAGLVDTDGHASKGKYYEITQKRKRLALDIREVADSLGLKTTMKQKRVNDTSYYTVNIIGDVWNIPVKLQHKKIEPYKYQRTPTHETFKITPKGPGTYYGFSVDKDQLILKADYVVQHNSGKTALGVQEAVWWATGYNPVTKKTTKVPATIIVVLDSPAKVGDVWLEEIKKWYPIEELELAKLGKPHVSEIVFKNGSSIRFMFHLQEELAFEGIQMDYVVFDEPPPRQVFVGLNRGARKKGSEPRFLFIGTPLGQPWLYQDLWKPAEEGLRDDIGLHRYSTEVNKKNLAEGYIENFSKNLTDHEKRSRLLGEFAHLEGLALAHLFSRETHIIKEFPWPYGKPVVVAIDPHHSKPHHAVMLGAIGDGRLYYIKELSSTAPPAQFAKELREWYRGYKVIDIICDSFGEIPGTGGDGNMSFSEKLRDMGIRLRSTNFKEKSDEDFITRIKQVLEIPEKPDNFGRTVPILAIFENCPGIVRDIENVQWRKHKKDEGFKEKLEISNKDWLACLKYALATNLVFMAEGLKKPRTLRSNRSPWSGAVKR